MTIPGDVKFGQKIGKILACYIRPFEILEYVGKVAYRLALPPKISGVHNVFNISLLRKYIHVDTQVIDIHDIKVRDNVSYHKMPVHL